MSCQVKKSFLSFLGPSHALASGLSYSDFRSWQGNNCIRNISIVEPRVGATPLPYSNVVRISGGRRPAGLGGALELAHAAALAAILVQVCTLT